MSGPLYRNLRTDLAERFAVPVRKITIDANLACPHRDAAGSGGCLFCDNASFSPAQGTQTDRRGTPASAAEIRAQVESGLDRLRRRQPKACAIAYFQPYSNTNAPAETLCRLWHSALVVEGVVGIAVGTRPDCVEDAHLEALSNLAKNAYVLLELGLQTANDKTLRLMNRGHGVEGFMDACRRAHARGLEVCAHVIVGLPGETREDHLRTAETLARAGVEGVKLHNLYIARRAPLADFWERQERGEAIPIPPIRPLSLEAYASLAADIIERLPPRVTLHRLGATTRREHLLTPEWADDMNRIVRAVESELRHRGSRQGSALRLP